MSAKRPTRFATRAMTTEHSTPAPRAGDSVGHGGLIVDTPRHLSASMLIGDAIVNPAGEKLGDLKDIVLDTANDDIVYA